MKLTTLRLCSELITQELYRTLYHEGKDLNNWIRALNQAGEDLNIAIFEETVRLANASNN